VVNLDETAPLAVSSMPMPKAHAVEGTNYVHLLVGKWHLGNGQDDPMSPVSVGGVTEYRGCLTNPNTHDSHINPPYDGSYSNYTQTVATTQGATQSLGESTWMGSREVADSIEMLPADNTPFVLRHWFHYSHSPWRDPVPDVELGRTATMTGAAQFPYAATALTYTPGNNPNDPDTDPNTYHYVHRRVKAGIEAADHAIGLVLASLTPEQLAKTIVIIRSDNGTEKHSLDPSPSTAVPTSPPEPPATYNPGHAKGTVYEQGINVPLIIGGALGNIEPAWIAPALRGVKVDALCSTVDIWATIAELTLPNWKRYQTDGKSLLPILSGQTDEVSSYIYSFRFLNNGACWEDQTTGQATVRDVHGFKLIRRRTGLEEFYNLTNDDLELVNLIPIQDPVHQMRYAALAARLDYLLDPAPSTSFCYGDGNGASCPCNNNNDGSAFCGKAGCANSHSSAGTALTALGVADVTDDSLNLKAYGVPPESLGIFLQYDTLSSLTGAPMMDGLSCAGGSALEVETVLADIQGNATSYGVLSVLGFVAAGDSKSYQFWYRDNPHGQCTSLLNWSNGVTVQWNP
jgi:arylsulfatase A-like enzyme